MHFLIKIPPQFLAIDDRISTSSATAGGPIAALTAMLHERGITVETLKFQSALRAVIACANRLFSAEGAA